MTRYFVCLGFKHLESVACRVQPSQTIPTDSDILSDVPKAGKYHLLLDGVTDEKQAKQVILQAVTNVFHECHISEVVPFQGEFLQKILNRDYDVWTNNESYRIPVYYPNPGINQRDHDIALSRWFLRDGGNPETFPKQRDILHFYEFYVNCRPEKPGDDEAEYAMLQAIQKYNQLKDYAELSDERRLNYRMKQLHKATIIGVCNSLMAEIVFSATTLQQITPSSVETESAIMAESVNTPHETVLQSEFVASQLAVEADSSEPPTLASASPETTPAESTEEMKQVADDAIIDVSKSVRKKKKQRPLDEVINDLPPLPRL